MACFGMVGTKGSHFGRQAACFRLRSRCFLNALAFRGLDKGWWGGGGVKMPAMNPTKSPWASHFIFLIKEGSYED